MAKITKQNSRPIIFLAVGLLNTAIDFVFFSTLAFFLGNDNIALVGFISGILALFCAYITHRLITWKDRSVSKLSIVKFFVVTGFGLWVIRPILLFLFIKLTDLHNWAWRIGDFVAPGVVSYDFVASSVSFFMMVVIVMVYNYFLYSRFVFKDKPTGTDQGIH